MSTPLQVFAPGKLFLIGEYAVLHGGRALVAAIDAGISCRIEAADDWRVVASDLGIEGTLDAIAADPRGALLAAAARAAREEYALDRSLAFHLSGNRQASRRKVGLGGSAASVVAILGAAAAVAGADLRSRSARDRVFARALAIHRSEQRGRGSGADVAASVYGGWLDYSLAEGGPRIAHATLPQELAIAAAWSGTPSDTTRAIEALDAAKIGALRPILDRFWSAVESRNRDAILVAIDAYGSALEAFDGTSGSRRIAELVAAARSAGFAAKGSGAVGGDCAIAVAFERSFAPLHAEWRARGAEPLAISVDRDGLRREDRRA